MVPRSITKVLGILVTVAVLSLAQMPAGQAAPAGQSAPLGVTDAPCPSCRPYWQWNCVHGQQSWDDYCDPAVCGI